MCLESDLMKTRSKAVGNDEKDSDENSRLASIQKG